MLVHVDDVALGAAVAMPVEAERPEVPDMVCLVAVWSCCNWGFLR